MNITIIDNTLEALIKLREGWGNLSHKRNSFLGMVDLIDSREREMTNGSSRKKTMNYIIKETKFVFGNRISILNSRSRLT